MKHVNEDGVWLLYVMTSSCPREWLYRLSCVFLQYHWGTKIQIVNDLNGTEVDSHNTMIFF